MFGYTYLPGTHLLQTLTKPNNMSLTLSYEDKRDLLTGMSYKRGNTGVASRTYTYDAAGRPITRNTARNGTTVNDSFGYNTRSELTAATVNNGTYSYNYDNIGNRNTAQGITEEITNYTANNLNQYTAIGDFAPTYDAAGNQTLVKTTTGIWTVAYDAENRPVSFTNAETNTVIECAYDYMGRRATKKVTVNGVVTLHHRYLYRGYLQIACCDLTRSNHPCLWLITWDPTQPIATRPLALQKDGTWYTYGWDLTKNICELYGQHGYIRTNYTYTPYGEVTESANSVYQPIQWSSEFHDSELALVYYNYRHYNPTDGRWLGRDRIIEKNAYLSLRNSTIQHYDYLGNIIIPLLFAKAIKEYLYYKEDCLKKRAKALNELKSIVFSKSGPKPNCSARNCSTITIIIEIGDPCKCYPYYLVGHTGIGINGDYYDLGPDGKEIIPGVNENVKPWWRKDENDPNIKPEALSYILSNLETEFSYYPTVVATFCACNETANKARKYWDKKYENMKNKSKCTYSIFGLNCSTSVWESLDISSGISDFSPECLLKNEDMLAQLSNQCGSLKGHPAHLELAFDRFE